MGRIVKTMTLQSSGSTLSTAIDISGHAGGQYYIHAGLHRINCSHAYYNNNPSIQRAQDQICHVQFGKITVIAQENDKDILIRLPYEHVEETDLGSGIEFFHDISANIETVNKTHNVLAIVKVF